MKSLNKLNPMPAQFGKMDDILRRGFAGSGHNHDLQTLVATRTFAAVVVGMAIYTLAEYLIERPADWVGFLTHHLLHVAVIGLLWGLVTGCKRLAASISSWVANAITVFIIGVGFGVG